MPPKRDAFALALGALRQRLRQALDAPGDALPINLIAQDLRLSSTPVREALSRLAGEDLVDKRGPVYTRPLLDGPALAELHNLRLLYLSAAMAPNAERRARRRRAPPRAPTAFAQDLRDGADPQAVIETLFLELVLGADDLVLVQAYQRVGARLAPFGAIEARLLPDLGQEALALATAFEAREIAGLRAGVGRYHRRRIAQAHGLARLASAVKYRPDIV